MRWHFIILLSKIYFLICVDFKSTLFIKVISNILAGLGLLEVSSFHLNVKKDVKKIRYDKTDFILSFADAFKRFDLSEWFLCRPLKIEKEFAEFVLNEFEKRMDEYSEQFPAESPTEEFMRKTRRDEWRTKAAASLASKP